MNENGSEPASELPILRPDERSRQRSIRLKNQGPIRKPASEAAEPRLLFNPSIDIYETEEGLVLYADLPA